ncbi:hypothetical protein TSAR_016455 [Trichomalopsis sarcophagae]|uniref:DUF4806 domain-containing protein n=1 Tax=Trichomalopsis sarcophagae TaxID=543379 RepID=A0A232EGX9_9HYME|nr:hypothetical protein TSAR_016455 [Trichomalopsis sarcophagae]
MYRLVNLRSRKPLSACSADHRARRRRLFERARDEYLTVEASVDHSVIVNNDSLVDVASLARSSSPVDYSDENVASPPFSAHDEENGFDSSGIDADRSFDVESCSDVSNESVRNDNDCIIGPHEDVDMFEEKLRTVFAEQNMTHQQIKAVLRVIKSHGCFSSMHVDPRTIMKTPAHSTLPITDVAGGQYLHLGVERALVKCLVSTPTNMHPDTLIEIDFSTDEASLDKLSKILMWPIQIRIVNIQDSSPYIVGVFKGMTKPSSALLFLKPFKEEMQELLKNGLHFEEKKFLVRSRCFVADAPARSFCLGHRAHNSRAPCSRCWVRGECVRSGVMVYKGRDHEPRTENEYLSMIDTDHHNCMECPLASLGFNVISGTVFDYMHLVCLGVMEKILQGIIDGRFVQSAKISNKNHVKALNSRLQAVKMYCPKDFARKPINIEKHGKFKATEQRQLLLYSGPIIFNGLVNDAVYSHFLLLHTAIRILVDPQCMTPNYIDFAQNCINLFNETSSDVYGIEFLSYNVHALLHLPDDVRSFGPLDSYSAFPYENNMTYCRKMCRKPSQHLQQIANRDAENCHTQRKVTVDPSMLKFIGKHRKGPTPPIDDCNYVQYSKVLTGSIYLSILKQDNAIVLRNGSIAIIQNIIERANDCYLLLKKFTKIDNFFDLPCRSSIIGVYVCSILSPELMYVRLDQVAGKCFLMPYWSKEVPIEGCSTDLRILKKNGGGLPVNRAAANLTRQMSTLTPPLGGFQSESRVFPPQNKQLPAIVKKKRPATQSQPTLPSGIIKQHEGLPRKKINPPKTAAATVEISKVFKKNTPQTRIPQEPDHLTKTQPGTSGLKEPSPIQTLTLKINAIDERLSTVEELAKSMDGRLKRMEVAQKEMLKMLKDMTKKNSPKARIRPACFPFKSTADLLEFDQASDELFDDVVNYLAYLGGANFSDEASLYFKNCFEFDEDLFRNLSWNGSKYEEEKVALKSTRFAEACEAAMNLNKNILEEPTKDKVCTAMTKAIKSTKESYRRKIAANNQPQEKVDLVDPLDHDDFVPANVQAQAPQRHVRVLLPKNEDPEVSNDQLQDNSDLVDPEYEEEESEEYEDKENGQGEELEDEDPEYYKDEPNEYEHEEYEQMNIDVNANNDDLPDDDDEDDDETIFES